MAIARINPKATYKLVSVSDDAIDQENSEKISHDVLGEQLKYSQTLKLEDLKIKEGCEPTFFICRNLTSSEQAELYKEHLGFDAEKKKQTYKDMPQLLLKMFQKCVTEIEEDGKKVKITADEMPYPVVQEIGSSIMLRTTLGESEKKTSKL